MTYEELLIYAYTIAERSPDPSTQNSALIVNDFGRVLVEAVNTFPDGVEMTPQRWERPAKYQRVVHAERNALFGAARCGVRCEGKTMVSPWAACAGCAQGIIQAGITTLVTHQTTLDRSPDRWKPEIDMAMEMFTEAGVEVTFVGGELGAPPIWYCGEILFP